MTPRLGKVTGCLVVLTVLVIYGSLSHPEEVNAPVPRIDAPPTCLEQAQVAHPYGTPEQHRAYAVPCEERIGSDRY